MPETLLTKCPHCGTTFRLTQAQLDIAGGAVRCGACYQVFHASEHIVKTAVVEEIRQPPPPKPDPVEEAFDLKSDEGLDPYDTAELDMDSPDADLFSEDYRKSMDVESTMDEFGYPEAETRSKKKGVDESWAEELLKELGESEGDHADDLIHDDVEAPPKKSRISSADSAFSLDDEEEEKPKPKKKSSGLELSDTFRNLGTFSSDDPFSISEIEAEEMSDNDSGDDESWAKAMLDELEEEHAPRKAQPEDLSILLDESEKEDNANPFASRDLARDKQEAVKRSKEQKKQQPKAPKPKDSSDKKSLRNSETEEFFRLLDEPETAGNTVHKEPTVELSDLESLEDDLRDTAVEPDKLFKDADEVINRQIKISSLHYADEEPVKHTGRNILLAFGSLLLMALLGAQYLYFHFNDAARNPTLRPWLEQACTKLGCKLPSQVDLSAIVGTNLVVRSHPYERNALVVDVIIKNKAPFEQPFPVVQLSFEDMDGNPVASRRFQPSEYIHEKSIDFQRMPPNTPIHLTLEIVDPGKNAVNYQIQFLPAGTPS